MKEFMCTYFRHKFEHKEFNFGPNENVTFLVYVYDFTTPFWLQVSEIKFYIHRRIQRGGGSQGVRNHKNVAFLSNTGPDPRKNQKATKPAFNVRPSSASQ